MRMVSVAPHSVNDGAVDMMGMGIPQPANSDDMKGDHEDRPCGGRKEEAGSTRTRLPWSVGGGVPRFGFGVLRT